MNPSLIAVIVIVDIVVTVLVLRAILARRGGLTAAIGKLREVSAAAAGIERETRDYLAANWSGDPSSLPGVVEPLLAKLEAGLRERGMELDRAQLKPLVEQVILRQAGVNAGDVREAMKRVA